MPAVLSRAIQPARQLEVEIRDAVETKIGSTRFGERSGRISGRAHVLERVVDGTVISRTIAPRVERSSSGCAAGSKETAKRIVERVEVVFVFVVDPVAACITVEDIHCGNIRR